MEEPHLGRDNHKLDMDFQLCGGSVPQPLYHSRVSCKVVATSSIMNKYVEVMCAYFLN